MCARAGTGHVTSSFSCAEILASLYFGKIMRYKADDPKWDGRDRFILSKGQASPILYTTLAKAGFFPVEWLEKFCEKKGPFGVHLQHDVPGVEITAGSLGHGLGIGCGVSLAAKMDRKEYLTFVLLGDAELYEGSNWEAAMFASHNKLNNLVGIVDRNWLGVTDYTENMCALEPLEDKFRSYGWHVRRVNGHNIEQLLGAFDGIRSFQRKQPLMIIADTVKGKGACYLENNVLFHGLAPKGDEIEKVRMQLCGGNENE
jgi:transketolase